MAKKKTAAAKPETTTASTSERGGKSDAIRAYIAEHPEAKGKEIVDGLAAKGVEVKYSLVQAVKNKAKAGGDAAKKPGRKRGGGGVVPLDGKPSLSEVANAIDVLKRAGLTV